MMPSLRPAIEQAFEYLFPLYEMARTRYLLIENPANPRRLAPGAINHRRLLADHRSRAVTTPNNDTLYSSSWLDLASAPVIVSIPRIAARYWSVALMDIFTNNFAMLGSRLDGEGPLQVLVAGPHWQGNAPDGLRVVRAPCNDVWLLARWLIDGPHDTDAVHAIQDAMRIEAVSPAAPRVVQSVAPGPSTDPHTFLAVANEMLLRNPVPAAQRMMVERWSSIGVRPGDARAWDALDESVRSEWRERIEPLHAPLREGLWAGAHRVSGWAYPPAQIGQFGTDYRLRAAVALGGLGALEPLEALYLGIDHSPDGQPLSGSRPYRLAVPGGGVPTDAFWSLSMYELLPDGRSFFVDNPIGRYAVGDRSPGLARRPDGSFDLWIQRDRPDASDPRAPNWLPAPAGRFQLTLRAYLPRPELLAGRAPLPILSVTS
ncbi:MAG: DUF1254 domain-containing protein [Burkholderiaceae bacterium]|nr:DUF1254 domain-containing protein [Burkholderiaceae bacterium]